VGARDQDALGAGPELLEPEAQRLEGLGRAERRRRRDAPDAAEAVALGEAARHGAGG
jgi:hypothetical protein